MRKIVHTIKKTIFQLYYRKLGYDNKGHHYEQLLGKYNNIENYLQVYKDALEKKKICTSNEIFLKNNLEFDCTINKAERLYDKPHYVIKNTTDHNINILFYRLLIGGQKVKCEMHFYEKRLFFFNYTFSYVTDPDKELIIKVIHNKYLSDSFDYQNENIIDKNGNIITINESHGLVINYIASTHKFFKEVTSLMEINKFTQIKKDSQKAKRLYEQL